MSGIKAKLAKAKYIAITSDIWSRDTRSFIAVNAHWINTDGKLETALLACERFMGNQTADEIAAKLKSILNKYEILSKCVAITTDNASNFKCCLKKHSDDYENLNTLMQDQMDEHSEMLFQLDLDDLSNIWCSADEIPSSFETVPLTSNEAEDDDPDTDGGFTINRMPSNIIGHVVDDPTNIVHLPNRIDCSAHTFNLIGKVDSFKALQSHSVYSRQYVAVFTKLNEIWRVNSTRLGRETFKKYLKDKTILKPHRIRWNRIYDAVNSLYFCLWFANVAYEY